MSTALRLRTLRPSPLPREYRQTVPSGPTYFKLTETLAEKKLNTVCEEAKCPNRTHCYAQGTLTFQILGDICTRRCGFCAETTGVPLNVDFTEPDRVVQAAEELKLSHVVITAPARDDLQDGGAGMFAKTVRLFHEKLPKVTVEILISDLLGNEEALRKVLESLPHVFNHNIETVRRLTPQVRAKATYDRTLSTLSQAAAFSEGRFKVKSGVMVGLGETQEELAETFSDLRRAGVQYLTVGQYLQPSAQHLPILKFYAMEDFAALKAVAERFDFEKVFCGPLVRSSYHAGEMIASV
jgi:lipoic acid synthetase